ncbi:hypothetical protein [Streptomyces spororaveus]|uniref:hypothetical protein n=1 Tax=Streptomyces spororaveus TaxID=284039 RepID=UPI0019223F34|nr:hypothetical protein [Streptomyces spororaveus]
MARGTCPFVGFESGHQAFPASQQVGEVGLEVGEVGDVGGEVLAPQAAEPQRARVAAGGDVGGFAADPVRGGDLPDGAADVLGVEQALGRAPDSVAVPVELEGRDPVDGFPTAFRADPVVALGGGDEPVVHQLLEDVGVHSGVGVPLGVAVPVGEDAGLVERHQVGHGGPTSVVMTGRSVLTKRSLFAHPNEWPCRRGALGGQSVKATTTA